MIIMFVQNLLSLILFTGTLSPSWRPSRFTAAPGTRHAASSPIVSTHIRVQLSDAIVVCAIIVIIRSSSCDNCFTFVPDEFRRTWDEARSRPACYADMRKRRFTSARFGHYEYNRYDRPAHEDSEPCAPFLLWMFCVSAFKDGLGEGGAKRFSSAVPDFIVIELGSQSDWLRDFASNYGHTRS